MKQVYKSSFKAFLLFGFRCVHGSCLWAFPPFRLLYTYVISATAIFPAKPLQMGAFGLIQFRATEIRFAVGEVVDSYSYIHGGHVSM